MDQYVVSELGPIDHRPVGADVTNRYSAEVLDRLVAEGYVIKIDNSPVEVLDDEGADDAEGD